MSLNNLAIHMAAQGRGPDRTLVHMSPREVQGLQALAMSQGGSLTINPVTGLPEAGFLDKFLPAIAGFALNTFAPGVGTAVGSLFGLGSAAGTALTVGGISALSSNSLENGIMAGLSAYGGAGIAGNLGDAGAGINARAANEAAIQSGLTDTARVEAIQAAAKPDVGAGLSTLTSKDFIKPNLTNLALAAAPALLDQGQELETPAKKTGYTRNYGFNPRTGQYSQISATPLSNGGAVAFEEGGSVNPYVFGGVRQRNYFIDPSDKRTDTQKSLDYLSGKKDASGNLYTNPFNPPEVPLPLDYATRQGGEYQFDQATNSYIWVPKTSATTPVKNPIGIAALPSVPRNDGGGGDRDVGSRGGGFDQDLQDRENAEPGDRYAPVPNNNPGGVNTNKGLIPDILSSAMVGRIVNFLGSKQDPTNVPVEDRTGVPVSDASENAQPGDRYAGGNLGGKPNPGSFDTTPVGPADNPGPADPSDGYGGGPDGGSEGLGGGVEGSGSNFNRGGLNLHGKYYPPKYARGGIAALAQGGLGSLGGYSDGGQLLRGPGDGVSDSIPASIANKRPARLADGEFVVPARIVSELGNGSTEAGARELYKMMARIQANRKKTVGKSKTAVDSKSSRYLPA